MTNRHNSKHSLTTPTVGQGEEKSKVAPQITKKKFPIILFYIVLIAVFLFFGWLLVPGLRDKAGGLSMVIWTAMTGLFSFLKNLRDVVEWLEQKGVIPTPSKKPVDRERYDALEKTGGVLLWFSLFATILGAIFFALAFFNAPRMGKTVSGQYFLDNYGAMYMGDTGDIQFSRLANGENEFVYETNGLGPHQWEYKYIAGTENPVPTKFAGIMLADGGWGSKPADGYDLRWYKEIRWKACAEAGSDLSANGEVVVQFVAGGIDWHINDSEKKTEPVLYPDSLPNQSLGIYSLGTCPAKETMSFSLVDMPPANLQKVIGGFGWVVSWAPNDVTANVSSSAPEKAKTIKIIISDIQYVKDDSLGAILNQNLELFLTGLFVAILLAITVYVYISQTKSKPISIQDQKSASH